VLNETNLVLMIERMHVRGLEAINEQTQQKKRLAYKGGGAGIVDAGALGNKSNHGGQGLLFGGNDGDSVVLLLKSSLGLLNDGVGSDLGVLGKGGLGCVAGCEGGVGGEEGFSGSRHVDGEV
jgi:hypothetical protein